jgi:dephospho-CoA kinase
MPGLLADDRVCAIVLDAPKLYEAGLETQCDVVLFVDSGRHVRLQRVGETRGWSEDELDRREKLQFSLDKKRARADYIISNNSTLECLRIEVGRVFALILGTFRKT